MPSFITDSGFKITVREYGRENYLLVIVSPNGNVQNIELNFGNITALSAIINSLVLQKEI
jgi:hypothetical protein